MRVGIFEHYWKPYFSEPALVPGWTENLSEVLVNERRNHQFCTFRFNRYRRKRPKVDASIFDSVLSHARRSDASQKKKKIACPLLDVFNCGQVRVLACIGYVVWNFKFWHFWFQIFKKLITPHLISFEKVFFGKFR